MATRAMSMDLYAALGIQPQFVVDGYRNKYPKVVKFWQESEYAFRRVLTSTRGDSYVVGRCEFIKRDDCVQIILPSGRPITYTNARICDDPYGKTDRDGYPRQVIAYDMATKGKVVVRTTYGGKIVENITQAFCRDLLSNRMLVLDDEGMDLDFHVHDEAIASVLEDEGEAAAAFMAQVFREVPAWAKDFPLWSNPEVMRRYGK
jgi:DNA polymerase